MPAHIRRAIHVQTLILDLRLLRGWTATRLAQTLQLPLEEVTQAERGRATAELVVRLSEVFGVDADALSRGQLRSGDIPANAAVFLYNGELGSLRGGDLRPFQQALWFARQYALTAAGMEGVARRLGLHACPISGDHPRAAAQEGHTLAWALRQALQLGAEPVGDLRLLVESRLGITVSVAQLRTPRFRAGAILDEQRAAASILLLRGERTTPVRRVELAHELCHILFDPLPLGQLRLSVDGDLDDVPSRDLQECRARGFAAEFLLPRVGVLDRLQGRRPHDLECAREMVEEIQVAFGTPWEITVNHLCNLGLYEKSWRIRLIHEQRAGSLAQGGHPLTLPTAGAPPLCMMHLDPTPPTERLAEDAWALAQRTQHALRQHAQTQAEALIREAILLHDAGKSLQAGVILFSAVDQALGRGDGLLPSALFSSDRVPALPDDGLIALLDASRPGKNLLGEIRPAFVVRALEILSGRWPAAQVEQVRVRLA